ncbi:SNF1-interacting protein [Savitreella phatthalungensis]
MGQGQSSTAGGGGSGSSSQRSPDEQITHIDGGALKLENGVYTGAHDWKRSIVRSQQLARRLAPYYKGLDDFEEDWTDQQLLENLRRQLPATPYNNALLTSINDPSGVTRSAQGSQQTSTASSPSRPSSFIETQQQNSSGSSASAAAAAGGGAPRRPRAVTMDSSSNIHRVQRPRVPFGVMLYKNSVECPICFLYYPSNIATTRCCRQPICTECFVQIKRPNPHPPIVHADEVNPDAQNENPDTLVMEAPVCPYCNETDFGVIYTQPDFSRARGFVPIPASERDVSASDPRVVLIDHIRPDWSAKLQRAKDRAARRAANAALITAHLQRQERRAQALEGRRSEYSGNGDSPRVSRRSAIEAFEEAQLAEAIRLSMLDDQDRQRRIAEEEARARLVSAASTSQPVAVVSSRASLRESVHDTADDTLLLPGPPTLSHRPPDSYDHRTLHGVGSMPMPELIYAPPPDSPRSRGIDEEEGVGSAVAAQMDLNVSQHPANAVARSLEKTNRPELDAQRASASRQ